MSLPKNVVSVDLGNLPRPVALDLLDASAGASVVAYADPNGHTRRALPYSASDTDGTVVKFYVDADEVWLSAKVNGHEVADAGGTTKYVVADPHRSDAAPAVQLEWNADRLNQAAPSGGSTPDSRISLLSFDAVSLAVPTAVTGLFIDTSAGTDLTLDVDAMTVHVATAGLYYLQASLSVVGDSTKAQIVPNPAWAGDGNMLSQQHNVDLNKYVWINAMARLDVGSFVFNVVASGGAGNDSSSGFAADVYRLA